MRNRSFLDAYKCDLFIKIKWYAFDYRFRGWIETKKVNDRFVVILFARFWNRRSSFANNCIRDELTFHRVGGIKIIRKRNDIWLVRNEVKFTIFNHEIAASNIISEFFNKNRRIYYFNLSTLHSNSTNLNWFYFQAPASTLSATVFNF